MEEFGDPWGESSAPDERCDGGEAEEDCLQRSPVGVVGPGSGDADSGADDGSLDEEGEHLIRECLRGGSGGSHLLHRRGVRDGSLELAESEDCVCRAAEGKVESEDYDTKDLDDLETKEDKTKN